jgi:DNA-binding GntR family transcriptional regulator
VTGTPAPAVPDAVTGRAVDRGLEPLQLQSTPALIADRLRAEILDGAFPADTQLSELELSRQLKVSRGPIREAMQRLIQEGLLRAERNRGVFVVELDDDDARDVYLARGAIERTVAAIVTQRAPEAALTALQQVVDRLAASADDDWNEIITHDLEFHQTLVEAAGSPRLTRMFRTLLAETRLCLLRLEPFYDGRSEVVAEHQAILDAIRSGNLRTVDRLVRLHMDASAARLSVPKAGLDSAAAAD